MNASLALRRTVRIEITGIVHDIDLSRCESLRQHADCGALMRLDHRGLVEALPQRGIDINGRDVLDLSGRRLRIHFSHGSPRLVWLKLSLTKYFAPRQARRQKPPA